MEHIVQFAIGIDDERIKKRIEASAEREVIASIKQDVVNNIFQCYYGCDADPKRNALSMFATSIIERAIKDNEDLIIEKAAEHLASKLARTKKAKAILDGLIDS